MGDPHVDLRNNWTALVAHAFLWMFRTVSVTNGLSDTSTRPRPGVAPGNPRPAGPTPDPSPHRSTPREVGRVNQVKNTVGGPHARARTRHTSPYTAPSLSLAFPCPRAATVVTDFFPKCSDRIFFASSSTVPLKRIRSVRRKSGIWAQGARAGDPLFLSVEQQGRLEYGL